MVGAGAIRAGEPAFQPPFQPSYGGQAFDGDLSLTDVRQLDGSPNVLLSYAVNGAGTALRW